MQITTTQSGEWNCKMGYKERQRRIEVIGEVNLFGLEAIMETSGERDIAAGACSGGQVLNRQEGVGGVFQAKGTACARAAKSCELCSIPQACPLLSIVRTQIDTRNRERLLHRATLKIIISCKTENV